MCSPQADVNIVRRALRSGKYMLSICPDFLPVCVCIYVYMSGFPAGFHLLGGSWRTFGGSSLGVGGLRVIKNKVSTNFLGG